MQRACSRNCTCHSRLLATDRRVADLERELAALQVGSRRQRGAPTLGMRVPAYDYHTEWERYLRENHLSDSDDEEEDGDELFGYRGYDSDEWENDEAEYRHMAFLRNREREYANRHRGW